jgi:polysaccharide export outer membrane protein
LKDVQIQENAVKAGWPKATVDESIAHVRGVSQPAQEKPAAPVTSNAIANTNAGVTPAPGSSSTPVTAKADPHVLPAVQEATPAQSESSVEPRGSVPEGYRIGAGDVLQISVWKEPEASVPHVVVRPDGKIGVPLLKEIEVIGLTPTEAEKVITARLSKLIPEADVTVVVTGINSKKIYIVGAVKKEGPIPYTYRMTVMQAISEAGGLNDYAKRKKIYILRTENGKDYKLPFDYEAALRGERMELNIPLLAGDTLVVPH